MKVALFITCLTDNFYPRTGIAVVRVLEYFGCEVVFPGGQTCCGQPMFNAGFHDEASALAARMIGVFERHEAVVTPSASCAAMVREQFPRLFENDPTMLARANVLKAKTFEFVEFLIKVLRVDLASVNVRGKGTATYHPSCHSRALGMHDEPLDLLRSIRGLRTISLRSAEQCCGFGGLFSVKFPSISTQMARDKVSCVVESGAETLVCNDAGCAMNIEGCAARLAGVGAPAFRTVSLAELLAEGLGLMEPGGASSAFPASEEAP